MILLARLIIFGVLAYSGLSKLGSSGVEAAARDLGLSARLARWVGRFLAPAELLVAGLIFFRATAYLGAVAALVLFLIFFALIAWNLWGGRKPSCACFGEASAAPISRSTLFRDLIFVILALAVTVAGPEASGVGLVGGIARAIEALGVAAALALIVLAQAGVLLVLWARRGVQGNATPPPPVVSAAPVPAAPAIGWPPGTLAPAFDLPSLGGGRVTLQALLSRSGPVVLIFTAPDCRHCTALLPEIGQWQDRYRGTLAIALVSRGSVSENLSKVQDFEIEDVLLQGGSEVADAYQAMATPAAVVVDSSRRIASRLAPGALEIRHLVAAWADRSRNDAPVGVLSPPPPADPFKVLVGDPAPPFRLRSLKGGEAELSEFSGRLALLVFWNPACSFCRALAPGLLAREKAQTDLSAQMVFLSSGTRASSEAESFVSPVLLDEGGVTGRAYGTTGTPSAILIDADGRVASALATGASEIEALMRRADLMAGAARRAERSGS